MSKELTLYDLSRMLRDVGFAQPKPAVGQIWYNSIGFPSILTSEQMDDESIFFDAVNIGKGYSTDSVLPEVIGDSCVYQPTIEDIMPKLPSWLSLECDVDRKTGEVTWSLVTRRHGLIMVGDLHWVPDPQKDPVIACGLAWLHFHSKKADHGKVDTE